MYKLKYNTIYKLTDMLSCKLQNIIDTYTPRVDKYDL